MYFTFIKCSLFFKIYYVQKFEFFFLINLYYLIINLENLNSNVLIFLNLHIISSISPINKNCFVIFFDFLIYLFLRIWNFENKIYLTFLIFNFIFIMEWSLYFKDKNFFYIQILLQIRAFKVYFINQNLS